MIGRRGGVRSMTFLKWSMMRDVTVAGPRKEVVRVAWKIAVRRRSPWPSEKSQKRAMHPSRAKVTFVRRRSWWMNLRWIRILGMILK